MNVQIYVNAALYIVYYRIDRVEWHLCVRFWKVPNWDLGSLDFDGFDLDALCEKQSDYHSNKGYYDEDWYSKIWDRKFHVSIYIIYVTITLNIFGKQSCVRVKK